MSILLLFSGGKDSFIAACKLAELRCKVHILVVNSGCLAGEKNALKTAERLLKKYGKDRIEIVGAVTSAATKMRIERQWKTFDNSELYEKYPNVTGIQAQCLFCQLSMWLVAIAYCRSHGIPMIASGYKASDVFCTGSVDYVKFIQDIANKHKLHIMMPMWDFVDIEDGLDRREQEMLYRHFLPSVLEPKCLAGLPAKSKISEKEIEQLLDYVTEYVDCDKIIDGLKTALGTIKITDESMESSC